MVMSSKAVESIYCLEELHYAVAPNKPVLPLMLRNNRMQYQDITSIPPMERVLIKVLQGLNYVELALARGELPPRDVPRLPEPKPVINAMETLLIAEDAAAQKNYSLAESLLRAVIDNDPGILRETAKVRLDELRQEQACYSEYLKVKALAENLLTLKLARYGGAYDPLDFARQFNAMDKDEPETQVGIKLSVLLKAPDQAGAKPTQSDSWLVVRQGPNAGKSYRI